MWARCGCESYLSRRSVAVWLWFIWVKQRHQRSQAGPSSNKSRTKHCWQKSANMFTHVGLWYLYHTNNAIKLQENIKAFLGCSSSLKDIVWYLLMIYSQYQDASKFPKMRKQHILLSRLKRRAISKGKLNYR